MNPRDLPCTTKRANHPTVLAQTYADITTTQQSTTIDVRANLKDVHRASRVIGQRPHTVRNPLQRWHSERCEQSVRRASIQADHTNGLDASITKPADTSHPGPNHSVTEPADTDSDITDQSRMDASQSDEVSFPDSEDSDEEFGNPRHPRIDPRTRNGLEALIFEGKALTTLRHKKQWEEAKLREDRDVRMHRGSKYAHDLAAGAINQLTSFGIGGIAAVAAGNPWVFPVVSAVLSDMVGDRLAQLARQSTVIPTASKLHFENHRQLARALGDALAACAGKVPKKKFVVVTGTDAQGEPIHRKMTAAEALHHTGWTNGLKTWGQNLLARGLPFLWFTAIYTARDYYLTQQCGPVFFPNQTVSPPDAFEFTNSSALAGCPDPQQMDVDALRWSLNLIGGMLSGAMTMFSNQLISSFLLGEERTNYSASTWKLQVRYLEAARTDTKQFLDALAEGSLSEQFAQEGMGKPEIADLAKAAQALSQIQEKELTIARKKASAWTSYIGELDQATQKHRDETMITPEFTGKRLDTGLSMLGKFLSLLMYAYTVSAYSSQQDGNEQDKLQAVFMVPLTLIVLGGYMWRDDLRLVGHLPYGAMKGLRAWVSAKEPPSADLSDVAVDNPVTHRQESVEDTDTDGRDSFSTHTRSARTQDGSTLVSSDSDDR